MPTPKFRSNGSTNTSTDTAGTPSGIADHVSEKTLPRHLPGRRARYRAYARAVWDEYTTVPDDAFKPARAQLLTSLLDARIFHTEPGRARWEERARRNITDEIRELTD